MKLKLIRSISILLFVFIALGCGEEDTKKTKKKDSDVSDFIAKVIYGEDDRLDLYQVQDNNLLTLADSTVALISQSSLETLGETTNIKGSPFWNNFRLPLCADERFREQDTAAFCSGFLVGPNLVATAGHCVQTQGSANSDCSTVRFVFGFNVKSPDARPLSVPTQEVYSCKRIVTHKLNNSGADYSLIELDRNVVGHEPLKVRRTGTLRVNDTLTVIGHPSGLPTKIAGNAKVRKVHSAHLVASFDTYGGNSGSAVFNSSTFEVEGILVRGETDFVVRGQCTTSNVCTQNGCRGEDATLISQLTSHIPVLADEVPTPPISDKVEYATVASVSIPDRDSSGISSVITAEQKPNGRKVKVFVNISHTWRGDLVVELISPSGEKVTLSERTGRSADDIIGTYGLNLNSSEDLALLSDVNVSGEWTLVVKDLAARDEGTLNSWSLIFE